MRWLVRDRCLRWRNQRKRATRKVEGDCEVNLQSPSLKSFFNIGELDGGVQMVTMQEVADAARVSRATVSRVLSNHPSIKPETRSEVMYWVKKLGYEPNLIAQSLAGNKTNLIGVLLPDVSNPLYSDLLNVIEEEASKAGYSIIVGNCGRHKAREVNVLNNFKSRRVDGIILRPIGGDDDKIYKTIRVPMVSIFKKLEHYDCIMVYSEEGSGLIADHFVNMGHKNIGYLGPLSASEGNDKLAGFKDALADYGISIKCTLECNQKEIAENQRAYQIFTDYLNESHERDEITAWYAHNDIAACDIIRALEEHGLHVPADVAVAGFNDTILAKKMFPTITSVAHPIREIGRNAVSLLVEQIQGIEKPREVVKLSPDLKLRESTSKIQ